MKKSIYAFTIVELIVVVTVISILSVIGVLSFDRIQDNATASQYEAKTTTLAMALEKYYLENGEYPSCDAMKQPVDVVSTTVLPGLDKTALTAPGRPYGENSITCTTPSDGQIGYVSDEPSDIPKSSYGLSYVDGTDGDAVAVVESEHKSTVSYINSPPLPTVNVNLNGSNVQATITATNCVVGAPQYGVRNRVNDGIWSDYSDWAGTLVFSQPSDEGTKYGYQVKVRCYSNETAYSRHVESAEITYTKPITAPSAPTVSANTVAATTTWSYPAVTCTAGTALFQYRYTISPSGYDSGWVGNGDLLSVEFTTSTEGQTYTVEVQSRCQVSTSNRSAWSVSGSASFQRPIAPSAPSNVVILNGANVQSTISAVTCTTGTVQYSIHSRTNDGSWGAYSGWNTTTVFTQVASDGVKYGYQAQARCYVNASTYSSASEGSEATYIDPIATPSAPVVAANTVSDTTTWSWPAVTCTAGTANYQYRYTISPSGYDSGWVSNGTNLSIAFSTVTYNQTYAVAVQARCVGTYATSSWGTSGSASYNKIFTWNQISGGGQHFCGLGADSVAYCWGNNYTGQLGDNNSLLRLTPVAVNMTNGVSALYGKTIKQIAVASYFTCAIASDDLVYCWGGDTTGSVSGKLGDNDIIDKPAPIAVNMASGVSALYGKTVKQISASASHVCVIASDNLVYCWGANSNGQLGNNSIVNSGVPVAVNMTNGVSALYGKTVKQVSAGERNTCVIASDDLVYCWGDNDFGQVGDNTSLTDRLVPTAVNMVNGTSALYGKTVKQVDAGYGHVCAVASDNLAYCWGRNSSGQVGNNAAVDRLVPTAVNMVSGTSALYGKTVLSISTGSNFTCAIASDNKAYCWGSNSYSEIGDNTSGTDRLAPVAVNMTSGVSALYGKTVLKLNSNSERTCVVASDNKPYCWGANDYGAIGDNTYGTERPAPTAVNMTNGVSALYNKTVSQITTGLDHTCAIANDNLVYCWGKNGDGEIGDNAVIFRDKPSPINVTSGVSALYGKTVTSIFAGNEHACAIANDNLSYCWGENASGQVGDNSLIQRRAPVAVNKTSGTSALYGRTVTQLAVGYGHSCALANNSLAYCWGSNTSGRLGDNTTSQRLAPVAVNMASGTSALYGKTVKQISIGGASGHHTCALASNDLVYCWGRNNHGQVGDNSTTNRSAATAVNMTNGTSALYGKTVKQIATGDYFTCALASDNLVYCWGDNGNGQLGNNSITDSLVPVAVNMTNGVSALYGKTVKAITAGGNHVCVIASDNLIYCWGSNYAGQLGNNSIADSLVPVAVNMTNGVSALYGKTVSKITAGGGNTCAIANDNSGYCWGSNNNGETGNGQASADILVPVAISGP